MARTWEKTDNGPRQPKFYPPKTKAGRRKIPAPPELIHALKQWFLKTEFKQANNLIFPTRTGTPQRHRNTAKKLERLCVRAKMRRVTLHSFRHTFASSLLQDRASITEVQKYMGHKTPGVTLNVYSHFLPSDDTGRVRAHVQRLLGRLGHFVDTLGTEPASASNTDSVSA
jgi:integrase